MDIDTMATKEQH